MSHNFFSNANFHFFLNTINEDLPLQTQEKGAGGELQKIISDLSMMYSQIQTNCFLPSNLKKECIKISFLH